ncbi:M23 family metallopeptidase [Aeromicrobium chenweiae]|uniref:M23ase beta-sheet core domain-containing protein n=1 Tax=Aeromicrobium chenweiae TaxID=2079793 RepID=A0A2S0WJY1_9ACTN|nr:M23 family metallopeptidase [Aeromicrobium chenweiae]AWB91574.1 hypothetical protein C3E78_04705 [Aeromicrobium chenweiae]TGN32410.1 hypothetical protein E4L97_06665 [Aeromicrobium chenweiae]
MSTTVTHPRHRRALTALVLTAALVASLATPSFADRKDDLQKQKKDAGREQAEAKKHLAESTQELIDAAAALRAAQGKLNAAQATLGRTRGKLATAKAIDDQMQLKLEQSQARLAAARAKLKKGEKKLRASESSVEEFAVQQALQGDRRLNAVSGFLRGEDTEQFSEQMSLNTVVGDQQVATMQRLDATRVILKLKRQKVQKLRDEVKVQRAQAAANLVEMQRLEKIAEEQAAVVAQLVKAREDVRNSASAAVAEDERQYREKVAEANRLAAQLRALATKQVKTRGKGSGGDSGGALSYPVSGPVTSPFGMRKHPITGVYKLHDGTDFGVGCGTPIRAAASGTVIQQYFNAAYGNRVILNNGVKRGVNVVTTYNHLSRFAVSAGSKVSRGQVIGYVGTTGYSTGCHLHFMVLSNGTMVNPMGWL